MSWGSPLLALVAVLLTLALPGSAPAVDLGVYYNGPAQADAPGMQLVQEQGAEVIRLPFRWNRIQSERGGPYDWSDWDAQLLLAASYDIRVLANLHGTPDWAASADPDDGTPNTEAPPTPEHYPDYRRYLEQVVERYGPGGDFWREHPGVQPRPIVEWEIHNEPNVPRFATDEQPDVDEYADLVLVSGSAIKSVHREAQVIVGSTAPSCAEICPGEFLERLFARSGVSALSDGVAYHAYRPTPREVLEHTRRVRRTLDRVDSPATPLHLTEYGWGTCAATDPERRVCVDEQAQARRLARSFELLRASASETRLATLHWFIEFDLVPCRESATFFCSFGLIAVDAKGGLDRKPAWDAYRAVARG